LEERFERKIVDLPLNSTRPISGRTDAENGYLQRADYPGRVIISDAVRLNFTVREHLKDGRLAVFLTPNGEAVKPGNKYKFRIGLRDDAMPTPVVSDEVELRIVEAEPPPPPPEPDPDKRKRRYKGGTGERGRGEGDNAPSLGLPRCVLPQTTVGK
jgi:hypothetical protein